MIVVHKDTDITEYVSSMSWGGSRSEVARKLELHIVNAPLDKNITPLTINLLILITLVSHSLEVML